MQILLAKKNSYSGCYFFFRGVPRREGGGYEKNSWREGGGRKNSPEGGGGVRKNLREFFPPPPLGVAALKYLANVPLMKHHKVAKGNRWHLDS